MIDIDPGTLGVSLLCLVAFIAPFIFQRTKIKRLEKQQDISFQTLSAEYAAKPDCIERWRNTYQIGLDRNKKKLIYQRFGENPISVGVDLHSIEKVNLEEKSHTVIIRKEKHVVCEYLALKLQPRNHLEPALMLEFYDGDRFVDLLGERVLAKEWNNLINQALHS
jgi:hypothetical protein